MEILNYNKYAIEDPFKKQCLIFKRKKSLFTEKLYKMPNNILQTGSFEPPIENTLVSLLK